MKLSEDQNAHLGGKFSFFVFIFFLSSFFFKKKITFSVHQMNNLKKKKPTTSLNYVNITSLYNVLGGSLLQIADGVKLSVSPLVH